jgi:ABC-2 type transport system ATP-binding protein
MDNAIVTTALTKRYGDRTAVDHLSLRVGRGEIYGFLGLNGAGKTNTIRLLLGLIRPTAGTAWVLGTRVHPGASALWARVGQLVEAPHAYPELTVRENLELIRRLRQVADPQAVARTLDRLALALYADRRASTLSLGNAQRLGLAKALLHESEVLILDEPTNGLDPAGLVEVRHLLLGLARERGVTVFLSSHLLGEVTRLAGRIGVLHRGRLIAELDVAELERRRRWLVVDARDRRAACAALIAGGFAVSTGVGGALELTDERAGVCPEAVACRLVTADTPPTWLSVEQEDLEMHFLPLVEAAGGTEWTT